MAECGSLGEGAKEGEKEGDEGRAGESREESETKNEA